jgi:putative endonuclease
MRQGATLAFIEVRLRSHRDFGGAAGSVDRTKQQKIIASAQAFLQHHPEFSGCNCRFDVIAVHADAGEWKVEWLPAAFTT